MLKGIREQLQDHLRLSQRVEEELVPAIEQAAELMADTLRNGRTILVMGNGGSAADAQHLAAELVGRYRMERRGLPAIALTTDSSILTAISNDYGFEQVFARQVQALAGDGDLVIGISTSGRSVNVLEGISAANVQGCRTLALLGGDGGTIGAASGLALVVPSDDTPRVQEMHLTIIHLLCSLVEEHMFSGDGNGTA